MQIKPICNFIKILLYSVIILITIISCKKDDEPPVTNLIFENGVFIVNEGLFQTGTGTISFFNRNTKNVEQNIFEKTNARPLGNVVQSIEIFNEKAYIVVNNANKIEIVNSKNFKSTGTINNITYPRYFIGINQEKAYISSWADNVTVINLSKNTIIKTIPAGTGPEKMLKVDNKVFVLNQGGFSIDSTITVINIQTDEVIATIQAYPKPTGIQLDKNGKVWVMCSGKGWNAYPANDDSQGHLICIDTNNFLIEKDISFISTSEHPEKLIINTEKDKLYYNYPDGVYEFDINADSLNHTPLINRNNMFYGLGFDNTTGYIYGAEVFDFVQDAWVYRYKTNGTLVDSFKVGIIPGEFYFQ